MTLYAVQATVQRFDDHGWLSGRCLPTFFLDSAVQGILSLQGHSTAVLKRYLATKEE